MIGQVSEYGEPLIEVRVYGPTGIQAVVTALIDTGYTDYLTLSPAVIVALGLKKTSWGTAVLADGSETVFDIYSGWVDWHGRRKRIPVHEVETDSLMGMAMLDDSTLFIACQPGGAVEIIQTLPPPAPAP